VRRGQHRSAVALDAEVTEASGEDRLRDRSDVVERGHALAVDALVGPDAKAGRDVSHGARHWRNDDVVEGRDDLVARDDEHGTAFPIRRFQQPDLGLGYHGSASVIAIALGHALPEPHSPNGHLQ
jgi:hypothetical protein